MIIKGLFEITIGIGSLSKLNITNSSKLIISSMFLAFGGIAMAAIMLFLGFTTNLKAGTYVLAGGAFLLVFSIALIFLPDDIFGQWTPEGRVFYLKWKNFKKFMPIGDVNGDNAINDTDVKEETGYILGNPSKTFVKAAADMNGDGVINIVDVVLMNALKAK